ncbi:protein SMG7-like isoform X2 [Cimex lectularius]|uniref:Uncharacterized protein n=1 Tax=Cimex lectularius TaxID=79782 RepID=A0A8I6RXK9_CIMLE|nr:protein SMG7-like isoform X2 [Cimex lectularius]XP_014252042.1 protein SMG7-like isoform X2 [Cimex lectularius]
MVSRVAVEVLKKAEDLKDRTNLKTEITVDAWPAQQQLQKIYHDVLILDLEYALDRKVEQDLWNYCFKNYIVTLQNNAKDKKNNGVIFQNRLSWFLDCASGFYLSLLQEICSVFGLDLAFLRHDSLFGLKRHVNDNLATNKPNRASCYYICQHCLVHLGDIARYRNQMIQAESFYRHAVSLGANSGHPYNQLALLEASRGDMLSTVFYYTRSIAVTHKFPAAITNLANTFHKCASIELPAEGAKLTVTEYEASFLQLHALLYLSQDITLANQILHSLTQSLTPLIATQEFSSWKLIQMAVITIFMYNQMDGKPLDVHRVLSDYMVGFLNALLVPLYTAASSDSVQEYFGLPAVKIFLSWMKCDPSVVSRMNRQHLWRGLCALLNLLPVTHSTIINYINAALPEDYDLQGFLPLESMLTGINFGGEKLNEDIVKRLRAHRLLKYGEWLAIKCDCKPIFINESGQFEASQFHHGLLNASDLVANPKALQISFGNGHDGWKERTRKNVALQSLLKKSQSQDQELSNRNIKADWQENRNPEWWPQGCSRDKLSSWGLQSTEQEGTYSLFSGTDLQTNNLSSSTLYPSSNIRMSHQSLWSGPGPSPLERLLEQQKQLRNTKQCDT